MEVKILSYTSNPKEVIYSSARQCYSKLGAYQVYINTQKMPPQKLEEFISHLIKRGHLSPLEHVSFTFAVEGVSRVCTHQLVRHRIASYSQQSQRYVSMDDFQFVVPKIIDRNTEAKTKFSEAIDYIKKVYRELKEILERDSNLDREQINQDLRFLIPQASQTKIVITMNVRQLLHFFGERLCLRAQWEIRALASKLFSLCKEVLPEVFSSAGPKCKVYGGCPENNETCPLYPAALELGR